MAEQISLIEKVLDPKRIAYHLSELDEINFLKIGTAKNLIYNGTLEAYKNGNKWYILREELVRYYNNHVSTKPKSDDVIDGEV